MYGRVPDYNPSIEDYERARREIRSFSVVMDRLHAEFGFTEIAEGGARGADTLARNWARTNGVPCSTYRAEWTRFGTSAGWMRNAEMLAKFNPDAAVPFPGGRGTADMVRRAIAANVKIIHIEEYL